ncbi:baculoviral IAP repeat-containing protein 2-like isoform X2 [Mya arenaria]|uniref:baculoviral IAP repeat-containing protein 2-like isoform X2 n=1 Tax=Mya arenaria TaxID=6604 RepID=UPI0022E0DC43|nr:baculoviral IAP repeat-containing protein 2-like isoform X2 [Mya arenaria]
MDNALWDNQMVSYPPEHLTSAPSSYSSNSRNTSLKGRFDQTTQPTSLVPQGGFAYKASQYQSLPVTSTQIKNYQYTTFSAPLSGPKQTGLLVPPKHIRRAVADIYTVAVQPTEDPQNQSWEEQAKIRQTSPKTQRRTQNPSSTARNTASARQTPNSSSSAVVSSTKFPKYPNYTTTASRLDSFKACQNIAASTRLLSEAGFFFAGTEDCTRCFYCGIGLRHWSENDDPWTEHARFSLDCNHVVSEKGREFVNLVKLALELTNEKETGAVKSADNSKLSTPNARQDSSADDINKLMKTEAAQSVLQNDYSEDLVREAIVKVLRSKGANAITGMNLMQEILTMEDEKDLIDGKSMDDVPSAMKQNMAAVLSHENQHLRDKALCSYCKRLEVSLVFLPCGHLVSCNTCGNRQKSCVTCGSNVKGTIRTYKA